jgi:membrane-anchored glycerophosphoryl diester phosphodiesterase (GDPDase)
VASKKPDNSTSVFLAHLIVLVVLIVVFSLSFIAYVETLWMKAEIQKEARELRKLKEEVKEKLK